VAGALRLAPELGPDGIVLVSLSGRGDKDAETAGKYFGILGEDPA
jgi:tryptophan synthase beta chain